MAVVSRGDSVRVKWLTDLEKSSLMSNFEKRGWVKGSSEGDYCFLVISNVIIHSSNCTLSTLCVDQDITEHYTGNLSLDYNYNMHQ